MSSKSREKRMAIDPPAPRGRAPYARGGLGWAGLLLLLSSCNAAGPGTEPPVANGRAGTGASNPAAGTGGSAGADGGANQPAGGTGGAGGLSGEPEDPDDGTQPDAGVPATTEDGGTEPETIHETGERQGPSYLGSVSNSAECSQSYATRGHQPVDDPGARHPLFLYFVGTAFVATDPSADYASPAALAVTEAMARRGFVALSVQYDNDALAWLSDHTGQLPCLFDRGKPSSLISAACALPEVDCELGIATWGHSQGGYVAAAAYDHEPRVRAVWATGYGGDAKGTLPKDRLRVVNGEHDTSNGMASTLQMITGLTPAQCPDPDQCLRADGSGWIIVRQSQLAMPETSTADHCWFDRPSCGAMMALEPNWVDPASDKPFALGLNADWVAATVRR